MDQSSLLDCSTHIRIGLSPSQPNGIRRKISSRLRIVVSVVVVMQPGLGIVILAGKYADAHGPRKGFFLTPWGTACQRAMTEQLRSAFICKHLLWDQCDPRRQYPPFH